MANEPVPRVAVLICARNAAEHLRRSVPAALAQDFPAQQFIVVVIDNNSTDRTAAVARELGAEVWSCSEVGVVNARQFAWITARTELVAFLDADCEPPRDWLRRAVAALEADPMNGAVGIRLVSAPPRTIAEEHIVRVRILDCDRFQERNALQFPFVVTAGMVLRTAALKAVHGFDKGLGRDGGEDADLCWRLDRAGWRVVYTPDIEVVHHHRSTVPAMLRQVYWYGRSSSALFARWRKELGWRRYTDRGPYRRLGRGLLRAIPALVGGSSRYDRLAPLLEIADSTAFLLGKYVGSIRNRVMFL